MHRISRLFQLSIPFWFFLVLVWSYTQTDRALYYSSSRPFVLLQNWLWTFGNNNLFSTIVYTVLVLGLFLCWFLILNSRKLPITRVQLIVCTLLLLVSNPALSYDLFNYMFDARLVLHYRLDPHTSSAISFLSIDPWVSYMRNTFFPTTYGYVWTAVSLIPGFLGGGKFSLTFILFKLWGLCALILMFVVDRRLLRLLQPKAALQRLFIFFLNPLVLIETLMNAHNDIWMMVFAHVGVLLLVQSVQVLSESKIKRRFAQRLFLFMGSLVLLLISTQIKRATLLLAPVWGIFLLPRIVKNRRPLIFLTNSANKLAFFWADIAGLLLFIPLLTDLSRQFHPWYLLWSFSFVPFMRNRVIRSVFMMFTCTSMLRYIPILFVGVYSDQLMALSKMITWSAIPLVFIYWVGIGMMNHIKQRRSV